MEPRKSTKNAKSSSIVRPPSPPKPLPDRLREATRPTMVQAAPGKWVPFKMEAPPDVSLCSWKPNGDGTFAPLPYTERLTRLNKQLAGLLGFQGQYQTLLRLARAGFIEVIMVAPHVGLINLDSYWNHLRRCVEEPDFWLPGGKNRSEYRKAIF